MLSVRLSETFDVVIPPEVRASMGLVPGQHLAVIPKGRSITLVPIPAIDDLMGIAAGADTSDYRDRGDRA